MVAGPGFRGPLSPHSAKTISELPSAATAERYYGPHGSWSGEFSDSARKTTLAAGPGKLTGSVTSGGKPLQGLRLQLALNGAAMSEWTVSGADGRYEVAVPYGKYRVDGYMLDSTIVDRLLPGKIESPLRQSPIREAVTVAEGQPGAGLDFSFIDPVRKTGPSGEVSLAKPVVVTWEPYPYASAYRLQIVEQKDPRDYETHKRVFEWPKRPTLQGTSANLAELGVALKAGHYYVVEIEALDERQRTLSEAPRNSDRPDFRVKP